MHTLRTGFLWRAVCSLATAGLVVVLLLSQVGRVLADEPPALPSSFYGEIHISDSGPAVGEQIVAIKNGIQAASTTIEAYQDKLVYSIDVPGTSADENAAVIFQIDSRVVATGTWHSGSNVNVDIHPPAAQGSITGPVNEGSPVTIDASASSDWLAGDIDQYAFDCDGAEG